MDKILSINTIKNVFSALGAKTSDDNYGVALLDKTSGEPKGLMGMSDLASVLGVLRDLGWKAVRDANDMSIGISLTHPTFTSNLPSDSSDCFIVDFMNTENNEDFQFCVDIRHTTLWLRCRVNGTWGEWKQL